jgi:hypothetical protein
MVDGPPTRRTSGFKITRAARRAGNTAKALSLREPGQDRALIRQDAIELRLIPQEAIELPLVGEDPTLVCDDRTLIGDDLLLVPDGRRLCHEAS